MAVEIVATGETLPFKGLQVAKAYCVMQLLMASRVHVRSLTSLPIHPLCWPCLT